MAVKVILRNKEYEIKPGLTLRQAIKQLGLNPESYLATCDGEMITEDEVLNDNSVIRLIAVISGGSVGR